MDKGTVVCPHNGMLLSISRDKLLRYRTVKTKLTNMRPSEISHTVVLPVGSHLHKVLPQAKLISGDGIRLVAAWGAGRRGFQ